MHRHTHTRAFICYPAAERKNKNEGERKWLLKSFGKETHKKTTVVTFNGPWLLCDKLFRDVRDVAPLVLRDLEEEESRP